MGEVEAAARSRSRAGDIADIARLGPQAREAIRGASPEQARIASTARGMAQGPQAAFQEALRSQMVGAGLQQQRQQQAMGALQAGQGVYGDVFQQVLGRPSQAFAGSQGFLGQAQGFNPGQLFNPESAYAQNIYAGNQQAIGAANAAGASATGSLLGGLFSGLGAVGGGFAAGRR
jgi:hypothetical protein